MKLTQPTTTSVIAVMTVSGILTLLGYMAVIHGNDPTTRTQIITGLITSLGMPLAYYYGASKSRTGTGTDGSTATTATMTGTITTAPTDNADTANTTS